jgi:hypothetical protein
MTTTTAASNDQTSINTVAKGGAALVDWELYGTRMTPDDLRTTLQAHGYDPTIVPDIDQDQRIRSAGARWTQGRGNADRYRAEVTEDDEAIYVQVLRRGDQGTVSSASRAARRKFVPVASLVWDKVGQVWDGDLYWQDGQRVQVPADDGVRAAVNACRKACDVARLHHDHEFIRPVLIQAPLRSMGAVPFIRRSGGCVVVPMQFWDDLKQLQGFVGALGDSYLGVVRADVTDQGTVQAMQRSVRDTLTAEIGKVRDDLHTWRQRGKRISTAALGDRLAAFDDLRSRAQLYAEALGMAQADLLADVADAEADARDLLDVALGRKPKADPAPAATDDAPQADSGPSDKVLAQAAADLAATGKATIKLDGGDDQGPTVGQVQATTYTQDDLQGMRSTDLGDIARALGVTDDQVRRMRKADKVQAILAAQAGSTTDAPAGLVSLLP